ncbi:MAG: hypothetical protein Fur0035_22440 [Anaerolineales bacterium]
MTLKNRLWIALAFFLLPVLFQAAHYTGLPQPRKTPQLPQYASFSAPQAPAPSASLAPAEVNHSGARVLLDLNHQNTYQIADVELFTRALAARGATVEYYFVTDLDTRPLAERLKYADAFVLFSPYMIFEASEISALRDFVAQGGRLLVFADAYRGLQGYNGEFPDTVSANLLLAPYGLSITGNYVYNLAENDGNFRNVKLSDFAENPLTSGLKQVVFYGARSVNVTDGAALIRGDANLRSSLNDQGGNLAVMGVDASGNVAAIGSYTFMTPPFDQAADNARLIQNLAEFALSGTRLPALTNFPFVFSRPVSLVTAGNAQLSADTLTAVAGLQQTLRGINIPLSVAADTGSGDWLILGSFSDSELLNPYFDQFGVTFEDGGETVKISGLGEIGRAGNGVILFVPGLNHNALVLLADAPEDLVTLINLTAYGDLAGCVVQQNIGVCPVGSGGAFGGEATPTDSAPAG